MIVFIVMIQTVLALAGLMAMCRLTRYAGRPLCSRARHGHAAGVRRHR